MVQVCRLIALLAVRHTQHMDLLGAEQQLHCAIDGGHAQLRCGAGPFVNLRNRERPARGPNYGPQLCPAETSSAESRSFLLMLLPAPPPC